MKPQSGGRFGQGAATAGDVRLGNFRKRPDPKGRTNSAKAQMRPKNQNFAKVNIHTLKSVNTDLTTHIELNATSQQDETLNFKAKILKDAKISPLDSSQSR